MEEGRVHFIFSAAVCGCSRIKPKVVSVTSHRLTHTLTDLTFLSVIVHHHHLAEPCLESQGPAASSCFTNMSIVTSRIQKGVET